MSNPIHIAITQRIIEQNSFKYDCISHNWYSYLHKHTLNTIQNQINQDFEKIVDTNDLIIFSGGDPDPVRDHVETTLYELALKKDKPIFGVCHGLQCLTMLMGGTISPIDGHLNTGHYVTDIVTNTKRWVNSYHRFKVSQLPADVTVLATDPDGNCESFIRKNIGGVMWHPEREPFIWIPQQFNLLD